MTGIDRGAGIFSKPLSNCCACLLVAGIVHIAVHAGIRQFGNATQFAMKSCRWLYRWIAESEIVNILCAVFGRQGGPFLEHATDPGRAFYCCTYFSGD